MGFNLGGGLSAMGGAIADTAGKAALEMQKADLEQDRIRLADSLASTREEASDTRKFTHDEKMVGINADSQVDVDMRKGQNAANLVLKQTPLLEAMKADVLKKNASDPEWVAAQRIVTDATASVAERSAAALNLVKITEAKLQLGAAQEVDGARKALKDAVAAGDKDAVAAAEKRMYVAQYSAKDEVLAVTALNATAQQARLHADSLATRIASLQNGQNASDPATKALIENLKGERAIAEQNYRTVSGQAMTAAKNIPSLNLGGGGDDDLAPLPGSKADLVVNTVYNTAKGPAVWNGTKFVPKAAKAAGLINQNKAK